MSAEQIIAALSPVFATFCDVAVINWQPYVDVLSDENPGDIDEALQAVQRDHGYRNAPLPKFVADRVDDAKRKRVARRYRPDYDPAIDPNEGELRELTIKGVGTLKLRVLPDDHPALQRFSCLVCKDTGWRDVAHSPEVQRTLARCECWKSNPILQRRREENARYVKERGER